MSNTAATKTPEYMYVDVDDYRQLQREHVAMIKIRVWASRTTRTTARQAIMKLDMIADELKEVLP